MLLARAGRRVVLIDRTAFPSDTMSTHFLWPRGVAQLADWGLLDALWNRGCVPIPEITFDVGPVQLRGAGPAVRGISTSCCPRRTVLDSLLVEAAIAAGAELVEDFVVDDVTWTNGRTSGIVGHRRGSSISTGITGSLVVGADGLRSTVATRVGAQTYRHHPPLTCVYYSYWEGVADRTAAFHARAGQLVLVWPTNDDLTCVYVAWPAADFTRVRADVIGEFERAVQHIPALADRLASGHRIAPFTGTRNLPNQYRTSAGPGWALMGDAGHHKDPSTGMGISDAFASAALIAARTTDAFDDPARLDSEVALYRQGRDAATADGFALTLKTARLAAPSPRVEKLYRAAAGQAGETERIFRVLGGLIPTAQ